MVRTNDDMEPEKFIRYKVIPRLDEADTMYRVNFPVCTVAKIFLKTRGFVFQRKKKVLEIRPCLFFVLKLERPMTIQSLPSCPVIPSPIEYLLIESRDPSMIAEEFAGTGGQPATTLFFYAVTDPQVVLGEVLDGTKGGAGLVALGPGWLEPHKKDL